MWHGRLRKYVKFIVRFGLEGFDLYVRAIVRERVKVDHVIVECRKILIGYQFVIQPRGGKYGRNLGSRLIL